MARTPANENPGTGFEITSGGDRVMEANWEWYRAAGFRPRWSGLDLDAESAKLYEFAGLYGFKNVVAGDAYNEQAQRPLRHMPGTTIYVRQDSDSSAEH